MTIKIVTAGAPMLMTSHITEQQPPHMNPFDPAALGLGLVVPVLGAHAQAGASGLALAMADAAAAAGLRVLLVDCADPSRSGLAGVCQVEHHSVPSAPGRAVLRLAQRQLPRGRVEVRRMIGDGTPLPPVAVPLPPHWVGSAPLQVDVTVVDLGWDLWSLMTAGSPMGPLSWCLGGAAWSRPVLVLRATAPSAALAEGLLARYLTGAAHSELVVPHVAAVVGAKAWPESVASTLGFHMHRFISAREPVWVPHVPEVTASGWRTDPLPAELMRSGAGLLYSLGGPVAEAVGPPPPPRRNQLRR